MLFLRIWLLVCSAAAFFGKADCQTASSYVAAVVEFHPLDSTFQQNIQKYVDLITQATEQGAQIIVFPEYGLTTTVVAASRVLSLAVGQDVPQLLSNPCDDLSSDKESKVNTEAIRRLSCAARDGAIYVVANLIERQFCPECASDNYLIYNSNVAFDANGTLVARYRKFNRYGESALNVTAESDIAVFSTSFGATFATFTCMDLLFYDPSVRLVTEFNVTDVAFPTAWFSELPFLTAVQAQSAWAVGMQVNFLGAGYNHPAVGNTGSGIYGAADGVIKALMAQQKGTTLLVATVPLNNKRAATAHAGVVRKSRDVPALKELNLKNDNLRDYTSAPLSAVIGSAQRVVHCQANLCCAADYELEAVAEFSAFNYRLVVIDGIVTHDGGNYVNREQVCSVIACGGENTTSCSDDLEWSMYSSSTKFKTLVVSGNFSTNLLQPNTLLVPSLSTLVPTQDFDFKTYPLSGDASVFDSTISLTGVQSNIHSFGIFSHDFEPPNFYELFDSD